MKKIAAALLAALMLLGIWPSGMQAAEYEAPKVYLNGILTGAASYYSMVQYVPIVRVLGYETSYDAQTHSVTSVKGDTVVHFALHSDQVQVTRAGNEEWLSGNGIWVDEIDGSTYVNDVVLKSVFGLTLRYIQDGFDIYDEAAAIEQFKAKIPNFYNFIEAQTLPDDFSLKGDYRTAFQADSNTFGIHLDGAAAGNVVMDKQGEVATLDFNMATDGLMNFYALLTLLGQQNALGEEEFQALGISLDEPISGRAYYDGSELYVQSESLVPIGMMQKLPWNATAEAKRGAAQNARDKWVKVWMDSQAQMYVTQFFDQLEKQQDADRLAEEMVRSILNQTYYSYNGEMTGSWYAKNVQSLYDIAEVIGRSYTIEQSEEGTVCRLALNSDDYRTISAGQTEVLSLLFGGDISEEIDYEMTSTVLVRPDGSQTVDMSVSQRINNIPNTLGIQCGTFHSEAGISAELTPGGNPFAKPEEYVDFEQVFWEVSNGNDVGWE